MTLNKKLTTALGYEIYGKEKERGLDWGFKKLKGWRYTRPKEANFGRALLEFIGFMVIVGLLYVYLIALN
jgi:hypothetical protein